MSGLPLKVPPWSPHTADATLHDGDVVPAVELERGLVLDTNPVKAVARVQAERRDVRRRDARQDRVVSQHPGAPNELGENQAPEPCTPPPPPDVDGILDGSSKGR